MSVIKRFFDLPKGNTFLFGPRGTGKSTWLKDQFSDAALLDFLDPETYRNYSAHPERLRAFVEGNAAFQTIIIDEIQRVPQVLSLVHLLIEQNKKTRFILTGSSARKLKKNRY
jgi:uncharacterized protein